MFRLVGCHVVVKSDISESVNLIVYQLIILHIFNFYYCYKYNSYKYSIYIFIWIKENICCLTPSGALSIYHIYEACTCNIHYAVMLVNYYSLYMGVYIVIHQFVCYYRTLYSLYIIDIDVSLIPWLFLYEWFIKINNEKFQELVSLPAITIK